MSETVRIMWINPLGYYAYDEQLAEYITTIKSQHSVVDVVSFDIRNASDHLEYRTYEALTVGDTVRAARQAAVEGYDGVVVGCFYDPGLEDAREISGEAVVVGSCQPSVQIAANLCNRFSVIVGRDKWIDQMTERVRTYGYEHKLASMRSIDIPVPQLRDDPELTIRRTMDAGRRAIDEDGAEALILGCATNFGFFNRVQDELGVPVIDPVCASLKMVESLAQMKKQFGWSPSRVGSCEPPPESEIERFGLFQDRNPIGSKFTAE